LRSDFIHSGDRSAAKEGTPLLSVVVTTYSINRLRNTLDLLKTLQMQHCCNLQIIVVTEGSLELHDRIRRYVESEGMLNVLLLINEGKKGLSEARNIAIEQAQGDILAFLDDDIVVPENWACEILRPFSMWTDVVGVTGAVFPLWEDKSMSWFPRELGWLVSCTTWFDAHETREVRNAWGHNMAFRRDAFEACGSFSPETGYHRGVIAEDVEFSIRVRSKMHKRIVYDPRVVAWHKIGKDRLTVKYISQRACWTGYSRRMLRRVYGKEGLLFSSETYALRRSASLLLNCFLPHRNFCKRMSLVFLCIGFLILGYAFPSAAKHVLSGSIH
jgi:GT2 family glycosyltransferase